MAVKVEALRVAAKGRSTTTERVAAIRAAMRRWAESGQLGPPAMKEIGRHTGARC